LLSIDVHGLKIQGRVHEVFEKNLRGVYREVVKILGVGYTFLGFIAFLLKMLCENLGVRVHFYSPSPCVQQWY
jgi:preprotein translocase subunit Sss1